MKLSQIYTNENSIFHPVIFREGLNTVIADIQHSHNDTKSAHNLGKSLLIDVIDFCLLKTVGTKGIFLKKKTDLFGDLVFFLEIKLNSGGFVTVSRSVDVSTKIYFKQHERPLLDARYFAVTDWDHAELALDKSIQLLNGYLELSAIKPWKYRKGFGYFLRKQSDYRDAFQLSKFIGKHKDWKPYMARVLGFDDELLTNKYDADCKKSDLESKRKILQGEITIKVNEYEKLEAQILIKKSEVEKKMKSLDAFDFRAQEAGLSLDAADSIETRIAELNTNLYNCEYDLAQTQKGLKEKMVFKLKEVQAIFDEAELTFPDQLAKDYEALVDFNHRIHAERKSGLRQRIKDLDASISSITKELDQLSIQRQEILQVLSETDSLKKFKELQRTLDGDRASLALMEEKSKKLNEIKKVDEELRNLKKFIDGISEKITSMLSSKPERYKKIQTTFSDLVKQILQRPALLYVKQNDQGNLEFNAEFTNSESGSETMESKGTTFKKILCIAFDLSILINHSDESFFRFVYHDGALEQLEDKRKSALLKTVRHVCAEHNIQYMFSALSEELENVDSKLAPSSQEIVIALNDSGESGRLFMTEAF